MRNARRTCDPERETVELLRAGEAQYLAHEPGNDHAWITSALVVPIRR